MLKLKGDGKSDDTKALQTLLQKGGKIKIPKGVYLISSTIMIYPKELEVSAYGATFIAAPNSTYNLISVKAPNLKFIWKGGTFDGNKSFQKYPGHPKSEFNSKWKQTVTNNGILGNQNFEAEYVLIEDVTLRNFVSDGICIRADEAIIRNCKAYDSALPIDKYPQAFKFRSDGIPEYQKRTFKLENCHAEKVYIGMGVASKEVGKNTKLFIDDFSSINTIKSSIHLEHIAHAKIRNIDCSAEDGDYSSRIHVGNQNISFELSDFYIKGGFIRGPKKSKRFSIKNGKIENSRKFEYAIFHGMKVKKGEIEQVVIKQCNRGIRAHNVLSCTVEDAEDYAFERVKLLKNSETKNVKYGSLKCDKIENSKISSKINKKSNKKTNK